MTAGEIKSGAEHLLGQMLKQTKKNEGTRTGGTGGTIKEPPATPTLAELGISKKLSAESRLRARCAELIAPDVERSVVQIAEAEFHLPPSVAQRSGPYSTEQCRYVCEPLEDFNNDSIEESTNCFAAQSFKTTMLLIGIGFRIVKRPANVLWLAPSYGMAQSTSETKWLPLVEASPALAALVPKDQYRFKKLEQQWPDCTLWFVGSGAEKNLKSKSAEIIVVDEADDVETEWTKRGKSALGLIDSRRKSYAGSKVFTTGTPQEVNGAVWTRFLEGDRRLFFVTCPECGGEPFAMEFLPEHIREWFPTVNAGKIVWDEDAKHADGAWDYDKVSASARMECPNCKAHLGQSRIPEMVANGKWIATAPRGRSTTKPSRRLPSMYSPHEGTTLGKLAVRYLRDHHKPGGVRNFLNEELALPYQPKASTTTVSDIRAVVASSPEYLRGEIPRDNIALLSMTVDVNQGLFHWIIRAWFADSSSALVDYGPCLSWEGLLEVAAKKYRVGKTGIELSPMVNLIDSGWRTRSESGVYDFCLNKSAGRFYPCKGATKSQGLRRTIEESVIDWKGREITLIRFDEPVLKYDLYFQRIKARDSKWWLPKNIGKDYEAQLTDEFMRSTKEGCIWDTKEGNNHLGDCCKMQLIVPSIVEGLAGADGMRIFAERLAARLKTA